MMKMMVNHSQKILSPFYQMQWLLILGLIQCMFTVLLLKGNPYRTSDLDMQFSYTINSEKPMGSPHEMAENADFRSHAVQDVETSLSQEEAGTIQKEALEQDSAFTRQIKESESQYHPIISGAASSHDVDPAMVKAIIMAESGYNSRAVSRRGARGLMQLMPTTAKALGVTNLFNPEQNINAGVKYFRILLDRFDGDERLALAAYNAGGRNVRKYNGVPPFKATRRYIKKVLEYRQFYKHGVKAGSASS